MLKGKNILNLWQLIMQNCWGRCQLLVYVLLGPIWLWAGNNEKAESDRLLATCGAHGELCNKNVDEEQDRALLKKIEIAIKSGISTAKTFDSSHSSTLDDVMLLRQEVWQKLDCLPGRNPACENRRMWLQQLLVLKELAVKISCLTGDIASMFTLIEEENNIALRQAWPQANMVQLQLTEVQNRLRDGQQYLNYFQTNDMIYCMLVSPKSVITRQVNFPGFKDSMFVFRGLCSRGVLLNANYARYARLAHRFYQVMFEPLKIKGEHVIVASGLTFIPVEAFTTDEAGKDFLLYHYSFSYALNAAWQFAVVQEKSSPLGSFLGMAVENSNFNKRLNRLYGSTASIKNIAANFINAATAFDAAASKKDLLQLIEAYDIVHIYAHAGIQFNEAVLYLNDSLMTAQDLRYPKNIAAQMVFLAACETAAAPDVNNQAGSIAAGIIASGVPAVVATLWQVEDKATYAISEKFYTLLRLGLPKDEALRRAKIAFIKEQHNLEQLPYYWAAIVLIGEDRPLFPMDDTLLPKWLAIMLNFSLCATSWIFSGLNKKRLLKVLG